MASYMPTTVLPSSVPRSGYRKTQDWYPQQLSLPPAHVREELAGSYDWAAKLPTMDDGIREKIVGAYITSFAIIISYLSLFLL